MRELNIIGDIAGNFLTLQALLKKMPKDATPLSLGDMVDRGPRSKEVIQFFSEGDRLAVLGNHEHMMLDVIKNTGIYSSGLWYANGGTSTLKSYVPNHSSDFSKSLLQLAEVVPSQHVDFISKLPSYLAFNGEKTLIASHAPIYPRAPFEQVLDITNWRISIIWNRGDPEEIEDTFQVYGHNSRKDVKYHKNENAYWGVGIDTSRAKVLTGLHWPSLDIYQQEYID